MEPILTLKYGEYYSLKKTDSGKNIINSIKVPLLSMTNQEKVLTQQNWEGKAGEWKERLKQGLTTKKNPEVPEDFDSWIYTPVEDNDRSTADLLSSGNLDTSLIIKILDFRNRDPIELKENVTNVKVLCEMQTMSRKKKNNGGYKNHEYAWTSAYSGGTGEYTKPETEGGSGTVKVRVTFKTNSLKSYHSKNTNKKNMEYHILNYRYKVVAGVMKTEVDKEQSFEDTRPKSESYHGLHPYTYPESTLLLADSKVTTLSGAVPVVEVAKGTQYGGTSIADDIGNRILDRYQYGRQTFTMEWQGDPTLQIGDCISIEDMVGIETHYMVTGNEYRLENSGKFFMVTEGISLVYDLKT